MLSYANSHVNHEYGTLCIPTRTWLGKKVAHLIAPMRVGCGCFKCGGSFSHTSSSSSSREGWGRRRFFLLILSFSLSIEGDSLVVRQKIQQIRATGYNYWCGGGRSLHRCHSFPFSFQYAVLVAKLEGVNRFQTSFENHGAHNGNLK